MLQEEVRKPSPPAQAADAVRASLHSSVENLLQRTRYLRCRGGEDYEAACRLRYKACGAPGMAPEAERGAIRDELDLLDNCYCYAIEVDGWLAATVRLHHLSKEHPRSASMKAFPELLGKRVAAGESFIDPGRFAADPDLTGQFLLLPFVALRLAVIACDHFSVTSCLSCIQEEHAPFYRRVFGSSVIAPPGYAPMTDGCGMLMESPPRERHIASTYERFPFFRPRPGEAEKLFS